MVICVTDTERKCIFFSFIYIVIALEWPIIIELITIAHYKHAIWYSERSWRDHWAYIYRMYFFFFCVMRASEHK